MIGNIERNERAFERLSILTEEVMKFESSRDVDNYSVRMLDIRFEYWLNEIEFWINVVESPITTTKNEDLNELKTLQKQNWNYLEKTTERIGAVMIDAQKRRGVAIERIRIKDLLKKVEEKKMYTRTKGEEERDRGEGPLIDQQGNRYKDFLDWLRTNHTDFLSYFSNQPVVSFEDRRDEILDMYEDDIEENEETGEDGVEASDMDADYLYEWMVENEDRLNVEPFED